MKLLILGLSSIVTRRVLPAAASLDEITAIDIASICRHPPETWPKQGNFYRSYVDALSCSSADIVYISLPNSFHVEWIMAALATGCHVIVDKPATMTLAETQACAEEANRRGLVLAEATVFGHHSQFAGLQTFADSIALTHVEATFVIPPMPIENFRNYRRFGGGCLADMGPYAAGVARLFGKGEVLSISAVGAPLAVDRDVDMGFSLLAELADGVRYTGHFSFESEYRNRLTLIGRGGLLTVERCFSLPADVAPQWHVQRTNKTFFEDQPTDDSFAQFLAAVLAAIAADNGAPLLNNMIQDAQFRAYLSDALNSGIKSA